MNGDNDTKGYNVNNTKSTGRDGVYLVNVCRRHYCRVGVPRVSARSPRPRRMP
jgi:hypothetical protein